MDYSLPRSVTSTSAEIESAPLEWRHSMQSRERDEQHMVMTLSCSEQSKDTTAARVPERTLVARTWSADFVSQSDDSTVESHGVSLVSTR